MVVKNDDPVEVKQIKHEEAAVDGFEQKNMLGMLAFFADKLICQTSGRSDDATQGARRHDYVLLLLFLSFILGPA